MRRVAMIIGSDSDLPQCHSGLKYIQDQVGAGQVEFLKQHTRSVHRNLLDLIALLVSLIGKVDVIIVGAGWANHLTGVVDAILRYVFRNDHIVVVGVAFEDPKNEKHNDAAVLSITEVPGTQVVYKKDFFGSKGFRAACKYAIHGCLPAIKVPEPKSIQDRQLADAIAKAEELMDAA